MLIVIRFSDYNLSTARSAKLNTGINYNLFYDVLLNLRELFHSYGRIDDSNSKLDEIVKLIMLSYYEAINGEKFSIELIKKQAITDGNNADQLATQLRLMFAKMAKDPLFNNVDGTSIFGANPSLNIQPSENSFAERIISEIEKIDFKNLLAEKSFESFDVINECFGHFVRENFRNNKEDAQYMTPAEITGPLLDCVFSDFEKEGYFTNDNIASFKIMDPTCGVGTLLIASARKYVAKIYPHISNIDDNTVQNFFRYNVIGQDKVDRMVRLSKLNAILLGCNSDLISTGNSISGFSPIDDYVGKVDFIFTNPPFGAEYKDEEIEKAQYPLLNKLSNKNKSYSSELLLLLKCINLLKENGKLVIVLPDSIFSAKGINSELRKLLVSNYTINAVFELPAVTFAQAGTRTKTSILYLTKKKPKNESIIMGNCVEIGYTVKERLGVPVKIPTKTNDMSAIKEAYCSRFRENKILSQSPSVTKITTEELIDNILNPSFYSAERYSAVSSLCSHSTSGFELKRLGDVADFTSLGRKSYETSDFIKHISVLHINPDCTIDFQQVITYSPICKGRECHTGDLLFSKINPRIPRMAVIPEFEYELVCSNEFEILSPKDCIGKYVLCLLLKTSYVSKQIESLTSGTSSSHSRIKREQLMDIQIPYPNTKSSKMLFERLEKEISESFRQKYKEDKELRIKLNQLEGIIEDN